MPIFIGSNVVAPLLFFAAVSQLTTCSVLAAQINGSIQDRMDKSLLAKLGLRQERDSRPTV